jgi:hypothetical protein
MSRIEITIDLDDDEAGKALTEILGVLMAGHVTSTAQRRAEAFGKLTEAMFRPRGAARPVTEPSAAPESARGGFNPPPPPRGTTESV